MTHQEIRGSLRAFKNGDYSCLWNFGKIVEQLLAESKAKDIELAKLRRIKKALTQWEHWDDYAGHAEEPGATKAARAALVGRGPGKVKR